VSDVALCSVRELVHELDTIADATGGEMVVAARRWRTGIRQRTGTQLITIARQQAIVEEVRLRRLAQRTDTVSG